MGVLSESDATFSPMLIVVSNNITAAADRGNNSNKQSEWDSKSDQNDLKNSEAEKSIKTTSQAEPEDEAHQDLDSDSESNSVKVSSPLLNHHKIININKSLSALSSKNESTALNLVDQNMITASHKWGQPSKQASKTMSLTLNSKLVPQLLSTRKSKCIWSLSKWPYNNQILHSNQVRATQVTMSLLIQIKVMLTMSESVTLKITKVAENVYESKSYLEAVHHLIH